LSDFRAVDFHNFGDLPLGNSIMRQAGTFSNREQGQRLVDHLHTQGVSAKLDPDGDGWAVWIREEDQLPKAIAEIEQFRQNPDAPQYSQASQAAEALRKKQAKDDEARRKNVIEVRDRWDKRPGGRGKPVTMLLIAACVLVGILTELGEQRDGIFQDLLFSPFTRGGVLDPLAAIKSGQIWRLITPIFIHFGPWHLIFNMFWLYDFGTIIESRRGSIRFVLLVLTVAVISNFAQYYFPRHFESGDDALFSAFGGGMSGVVYGLFGYIWMKSRFEPLANMSISPNTVTIMLVWLVACSVGVIEKLFGIHVANWAHGAGLAAGMIIGFAPTAWRKLSKRR
jgi:GlpG protein